MRNVSVIFAPILALCVFVLACADIAVVQETHADKKWGTILKKGAPHFPIFPVVEPFYEGAHCLSHSVNTANDGRYVRITVNGNPFSNWSSIYEIEMHG